MKLQVNISTTYFVIHFYPQIPTKIPLCVQCYQGKSALYIYVHNYMDVSLDGSR